MNPWDEKAAHVAELVALEASEWSPATATRFDCFMAGARWQREALLADVMLERVARGIHASHDRGEDFDNEPQAVQDEYLDMARAALVVQDEYLDMARAALVVQDEYLDMARAALAAAMEGRVR